MHSRSYEIVENLGHDKKILDNKKKTLNRKVLSNLKKLGIPDSAIKQIKFLENYPSSKLDTKTNKQLIESLIKKCRRSFDAFANKGGEAKIVFEEGDWTLYVTEYDKYVEKLHTVCKPYFDEWSSCELEVSFLFDGTDSWKVITTKESDLPGN